MPATIYYTEDRGNQQIPSHTDAREIIQAYTAYLTNGLPLGVRVQGSERVQHHALTMSFEHVAGISVNDVGLVIGDRVTDQQYPFTVIVDNKTAEIEADALIKLALIAGRIQGKSPDVQLSEWYANPKLPPVISYWPGDGYGFVFDARKISRIVFSYPTM